MWVRRYRAQWSTIAAMIAVATLYLMWQGRIWWCKCGQATPIALNVNSPHNSQHLIDPYSLSHVLHGLLFFGLLWLFRKHFTPAWRVVIATSIEVVWEMMENSPFIIERYRAMTVSLDYFGDSIANALADIASFLIGYWIASRIGLWKSVAMFVLVDLLLLWWIRDNLALNILMLLWPIDAVRHWQQGA